MINHLATTAIILCSDEKNCYSEQKPNMLVVSFSDTTSRNHVNAITSEQAREILSFVSNLSANIHDLYISCDAGQSRSPAVAATILRMSGRSDIPVWENPYYVPNWFVYQTICCECGLFAPDWYVQQLVEINRQSYKSSVKNGNTGNYEPWQIIE